MSAQLKLALAGGKVPDAVPFDGHAFGFYVPIEAHLGRGFQDMVDTNMPLVDAYSKVLQVFFALYSKVPEDVQKWLFVESVVTGAGVLLGYRYIMLLNANGAGVDLDTIALDEVVGHYESVAAKVSKKSYLKAHGHTFGSQWKVFFDGADVWLAHITRIMEDIDPHDAYHHIATCVFRFGECVAGEPRCCAEQQDSNAYVDAATGAFVFPKKEYVFVPNAITKLHNTKYPHVLAQELALTRIAEPTVVGLARAFNAPPPGAAAAAAAAARPPPTNRPYAATAAAAAQQQQQQQQRTTLTKPPADIHRFLPLAPLSQAVKAVNAAIDDIADAKSRYVLRAFCGSQMSNAYLHALQTSDMRSPGDIAMMNYMSQTVDGVPTTSCYWNARWLPVYEAMSSSEALVKKCLAALEVYFSVDMCHHEALMLLLGVPDCFRLAFETMKFCAWIYSKGGGVSKSFMLNLAKAISVKGMIRMIGRFTASAFAVDGTEENPNCPNQTMQVVGGDDWSTDLFSLEPRDEKAQAALKSAMTSQVGSVETMVFTDTSARLKKIIEAPLGGVFIVLANVSRIENQPMERRGQNILASEVPSKTIDETVIQSWEAGLSPAQASFSTEIRWLQYCHYMISTLQYAQLLPEEFTYGAAGVVLMQLADELRADKEITNFTRIDTSVLGRIKQYARLLEIDKICLDAFCSERDSQRAIGVRDFLTLGPRMYISIESMCNAAMFLVDGWLPSLRFAVYDALRLFVESKLTDGSKIQDLMGQSQTCLNFKFSDVVHFIVTVVPGLARGFTPNYATVAGHLRSFLDLPAEPSPAYRPCPDLPSKVLRVGDAMSQVRPFVERQDRSVQILEISIHRFEDVFLHTSREFDAFNSSEANMNSVIFEEIANDCAGFLAGDENPRKHQNCADTPCSGCIQTKITSGASAMTGRVREQVDIAVASQLAADDEGNAAMAETLARSFLWDGSGRGGRTVLDMLQHVQATWYTRFEGRLFDHFKRKMATFLACTFKNSPTTKRWEQVPDAPPVQWLETAESTAYKPEVREASDYASKAFEKVSRALQKILADKNQAPRRIFGGPDPASKYRAKFVDVGGCAVYDPAKGVTIKLKDRNKAELGEVDLNELTKLLGDLTKVKIHVNYDLDTWTQERHFEAHGIDPSVTISEELLADLSGLLVTRETMWDGKFLNGIPAKELAPITHNELPQIAAEIKDKLRARPNAGQDDLYFPRAEIERKVAVARRMGIPPEVFHLASYDGLPKTLCFAPLRQCAGFEPDMIPVD